MISKSPFTRLLGVWTTTGEIKGEANLKLIGTDTYEVVLEGKYILHKANVKMGPDRNETLEMLSWNESTRQAKMQYFNSSGEEGSMTGTISDNEFKIDGKSLKFQGTINPENTKVHGKWFIRQKNGTWTEYIDLLLTKQE
jgi:hypothetical protein